MEWFQHDTGSHDEQDYCDAWELFGDAAVSVFWTTLELYGQKFSTADDGWVTFSLTHFERKTRRKFKKSEKILEFFQNRSRIYFKKTDLTISIHIPKFIKKASNWSKRPKSQPTEAPTEVPTEAPTAIEVEEKRSTPIVPKRGRQRKEYSGEFLAFYKAYPNKTGKAPAFRAWEKERPDIAVVLPALSLHIQSEKWKEENGKYIPNPATWINQRRWEDEMPQERKPGW
ncbi:MAG: hypothetical protein WC455_29005 [Dehalococcoidia bacterium]|jgi:hypothetical protein